MKKHEIIPSGAEAERLSRRFFLYAENVIQ